MSKTDFRLWLLSHIFFTTAFFWWCLDSKAGMFTNICISLALATAAITNTSGGKEDGK